MTKWPRRKIDSKRRWIARFRIGKVIPITAFMQYPELWERLRPKGYLPCVEGYMRSEVILYEFNPRKLK